jgi:peptidoglycan hydrolase-like protein with peptidoglycan-binding domain
MPAVTHADASDRSRVAIEPGSDAARTLAFRRSLRASRTRRATAALRRRRLLRGRGSALLAAAGLFVVTAGAIAQQQASGGGGVSSDTIAAAQRALGVAADGVVGPQTRRATKAFQRANDLTVDGVIGPQTLKALGVDATAPADAPGGRSSGGPALERIAACESGGDPTAVSADGQYRGKYQFSLETWRDMGGSGDPAEAPEAEQDRRAAALMQQAGPDAWPVCSQQA